MAYIGKQPVVGNFVKLDAITTSATTTFNLLNGGVAYYPQSANNCIVSLNGVIQSPTSAYTISGSTIVFSDALTSSDTIDFILVLGDVLNIGTPSDGTVTSAKLASGVSGLISWQSVQTTGFTAVAGRGYPCNTTSSAFTVTLPASPSAGDQIILLDYAGTFATNKITLAPNGNKINGSTDTKLLTTNREAVTVTYVDSTQGWVASSGVNSGSQALDPSTYSIDFLVVGGGGGGGSDSNGGGNYAMGGGGGGAGGYRTSTQTVNIGTAITITVGDGGTGGVVASGSPAGAGVAGSNSSISGSGLTTITSAGGGYGGTEGASGGTNGDGGSGGSGGGGGGANGRTTSGGTGNTPSTTPSQGSNGGGSSELGANNGGSGGGGASAVGTSVTTTSTSGGAGGNGTASSITGSSVTYAGGGGGGVSGSGGSGGGGTGGSGTNTSGTAGTANTGGGGGGTSGGSSPSSEVGGAGGKGVVILSVPTASYSSTTTGSPTVTTSGSNTIIKFTGSGSYTA